MSGARCPMRQQQDTYRRWKEDARSEFEDSEAQNWRDNGGALEQAKKNLVDQFNGTAELDWATEALDDVRENYKADGKEIPYSNEQLMSAITLEYSSRYDDGNGDMTISVERQQAVAAKRH